MMNLTTVNPVTKDDPNSVAAVPRRKQPPPAEKTRAPWLLSNSVFASSQEETSKLRRLAFIADMKRGKIKKIVKDPEEQERVRSGALRLCLRTWSIPACGCFVFLLYCEGGKHFVDKLQRVASHFSTVQLIGHGMVWLGVEFLH